MPLLNYDSQRSSTCLKIVLSTVFVFISAFSEEELILDDIEDAKTKKPAPQNKTIPLEKPVTKLPQPETPVSKPVVMPVPTVSPVPVKETYSTQATKFILEKKYTNATELLWKNIEHLTESELVLLTKAHYINKDYFETMKAANLVLAKNEQNFEALTYLGLAQLRKKKDREAKDYFRRANEANPTYMPAINGLVEIYDKSKNYYELRLVYQDLIKHTGEKPEFLTKLCDINTKDAITDQAQTYCRKAVQASPEVPENYSNLGVVYKNIHDLPKAKLQLQLAADKFPKSDVNQLTYAQFLEEQKNFIDAFKYYSRCVKINEYIENCWVGYASSSYQIQKFAETMVGLKKACNFNKKHSFLGRKASSFARSSKQEDWAKKLDVLSEICGN
jgi:tetratricopeptide (TPR) repeat protein